MYLDFLYSIDLFYSIAEYYQSCQNNVQKTVVNCFVVTLEEAVSKVQGMLFVYSIIL
jgi:hypothetical protein